MLEMIEKQSEIIRLQADVISELSSLLSQHISADELKNLPCVASIEEATRLRQTIEWEETE